MIGFAIFQILFDAILFFTILFLFHFSIQRIYRKKEESDLLKNAQALEIRENLQEMLETLKFLGKEISDDIQEKIRLTDERANKFKGLLLKLERDLVRATTLSEKIELEKGRLEEKHNNLRIAGKDRLDSFAMETKSSHTDPPILLAESAEHVKVVEKNTRRETRGLVGVSPQLVNEIYDLADKSCALSTIVRRTKLTPAEVQLILNLRRNRSAAAG